jgi:hypothetical protein
MTMHQALVGFVWLIASTAATLIPTTASAQASREWGLRALQTVTGLTQPVSKLSSEHVAVNFGASRPASRAQSQAQNVFDARPMSVTVRDYGDGTLTKEEIVTTAKALMSPAKVEQISGVIKSAMRQGKVGSGVFIYEQQVRPKGSPRDMKLAWSVTVTENGYVFAGDPKVIDPDPTTVYMIYTSLAAETGLPPSWTHADAGLLKWQVRKLDGSPATDWTTINTGGAFDETTDSERMVNCLANKATTGCPTNFVDAKTLIAETASVTALIDYVRKVSPAYDETIDPSTGETIYQPQMAVSYDRREYDRTGCTSGSFRNIGRRGYNLQTTVDRYQMAEADPLPKRINRFQGTSISPTEAFDLSKNLDISIQSLTNSVIDGFSNNLVASSSVRGLQYLAPITTFSTLSNANNLVLQSTQGDMTMNWVPAGNNNYNLYLGTIANNYWSGYGATFDRSMNFNISNKDLFSKFTLAGAWFDDWLMVQVNGTVVYVGPSGGDRLEVVNLTGCCACDEWGCFEYSYGPFVQFGATNFGSPELKTNWSFGLDIDLRPHLRAGQNNIFMRTIVAGRGEGAIRIDATSCMPD